MEKCNINIDQSWERHYWTVRWGITDEVLRQAIKDKGCDARELEKYLIDNNMIDE